MISKMASLKISLIFIALLLISSAVSATTKTPFIHKPPIRVSGKIGMEFKIVAKAKKPTAADAPWGGGYTYHPPKLNNLNP